MSIRAFFDLTKLDDIARDALKLKKSPYVGITIGDQQINVEMRDAEAYKDIERESQLSPAMWATVAYVSLRDNVSDPKMVAQMASGEYDIEGGSAKVRLWEGEDLGIGSCGAEIEIIAPTWAAVTALHREILFGKLPDHPYARPMVSDDES